MGKAINFMVLSLFIQIGLILFTGTGEYTPGSSNSTSTALTDLVLNPQGWYDNPFYTYLSLSLLAFGALGVVVGSFIVRNEWAFYAGIALILFSFVIPFFNLYQFLNAQQIFGEATFLLVGLITAVFTIYGVMTVLDFSRGKDF